MVTVHHLQPCPCLMSRVWSDQWTEILELEFEFGDELVTGGAYGDHVVVLMVCEGL